VTVATWQADDIRARDTSVLVRLFDEPYPNIERGEGVWLHRVDGRRVLDACSGGASTACLGHGVQPVIEAAAAQAREVAYVYNHHFTNEPQELLARRLIEEVAPEMARVRFVSGGSEANETALRLVRSYHAERGESQRWRIISPAQAYHGALFGTLSLSGRPSLREPYEPYLVEHLHLRPSTWRSDPTGAGVLAELDSLLEQEGDTVAAVFCEPVSAAALPGYTPPETFWSGLEERRREYGFLVCLDEVVTGMGRTGAWLAGQELPVEADIVSLGKGLGAGYAPLAATLCRAHVYEAIAEGSRNFEHGHTWDGAPLPCAVGLAVLEQFEQRRLVESVRERGPRLRDQLEQALSELQLVREVRGRGFLLGVELVDPRDGESVTPASLGVAARVERIALEHDLLVVATATAGDGYTSDQVLLTPAFTSTDEELGLIVERLAEVLGLLERELKRELAGAGGGGLGSP
jgi:adenosylmethionine-8-amino-7-oxononanoate aminotransferase